LNLLFEQLVAVLIVHVMHIFDFSHCEAAVGKDRFDAIVSRINSRKYVTILILSTLLCNFG